MATERGGAGGPAVIICRHAEQWSGRLGFILATLGSAIGLGNIWRFAYVAGENGGGAFLLVYLAAIVAVGLPLLLAELALGRAAQGDATAAFAHPAPTGPLRHLGLLAVLGSGIILSYYAVIAGWTLRYLGNHALRLTGLGGAGTDPAAAFAAFIADPVQSAAWQGFFLALTLGVALAGVRHGIEAINRIVLPLLGITVIVLAVVSLSLPGSLAGVRFLLEPDWSALSRPGVYLAALGQSFFSLGIAMGALATYGGYLHRRHDLPTAAVAITAGDVLFALVAGLAIFPAVFAFALEPAQGPALAFVVLPRVFDGMAGGLAFGVAFFALLALAALTSAVSLLEVPVAWLMRLGWRRRPAVWAVTGAAFAAGLPSVLGFGPWSAVSIGGRGILDGVDHMVSSYLLPLTGLGLAVVAGWMWPAPDAAKESGLGGLAGRLWRFSLRYAAPAIIVLILARSLGLF